MINSEHLYETCKLGQGELTCSFLVMSEGFECAKGTSMEPILKRRRERGTIGAMGDNCDGWASVVGQN